MKNSKPIAIIGVGNTLMADEGIGCHAIQYLDQFDWSDNIELIDAGVPGPSLLHMIDGRDLSIIIDCADFKGQPGDVIVVNQEALKKPPEEMLSMHGASLLGTLALAKEADVKTGNIIIICVQPRKIEMTLDMSDEAAHALPKIREEVSKLLAPTLS